MEADHIEMNRGKGIINYEIQGALLLSICIMEGILVENVGGWGALTNSLGGMRHGDEQTKPC